MKPKVSVIVPVYNVKAYLPQCLDSLVNQTLKDIEIICVDDASTDGSLQVLEEYSKKDNRLVVITQQVNHGVGAARNAALEAASGDYIMFCDPDDWYELYACEVAYNQIVKNKNDVVVFNFRQYSEKNKNYRDCDWRILPFKGQFNNPNIILGDVPNYMQAPYAWAQIYSRKYINKNNIRFADQRLCEDVIFYVKAMVGANSISVITEPLYVYRAREGSISHNYNIYWADLFKARYDCLAFLEQQHDKECVYPFLIYSFNTLSNWYNLINKKKPKIAKDFYAEIKKYYQLLVAKYDISSIAKYINNYDEIIFICNNSWKQKVIKDFFRSFFYTRVTNDHKIVNVLGIKIKRKL